MNEPLCADCLCRVCALNVCTDNYNSSVGKYDECQGCENCTGVIDLPSDCPREMFVLDEE